MSVTDDAKKKAEELKEKANEHFKNKEFDQAIDLYSQAIEHNPDVAVYYGNRSFAYLKTECFGYALTDASKAIELDESYIKGYYRRAAAYMSLGKFKQALKDFKAVTTARPSDKDAKTKFLECSKIVKRKAFENAIAVDEVKKSVADSLHLETMSMRRDFLKAISVADNEKSVAESINLDRITIEEDYNGPKLEDGKVTLEFMKILMETYKEGKNLHRRYAYQILLDVKAFFEKAPTMVEVTIPEEEKFTVCGDIHGQFYDLMNIFDMNGLPSEKNPYLFNGDFVDRGSFSVECIFTLFGFKLLYPNHFFMSRGNHESQTMNQMYGFEGEVKAKYSPQMSELFTEVYNWLPLCHLLNNRVLVMHGGLFSEPGVTLDDIRKIDRNKQPPEKGLMCELLWSDPQPQLGISPSKRGVGVQFGPDVTKEFLTNNKLDYIIRSHEVKADGYEVTHDGKCITVFSAPNYCDTMRNKGAYITLKGNYMKPKFETYTHVPHPNVKPMAYANRLLAFM